MKKKYEIWKKYEKNMKKYEIWKKYEKKSNYFIRWNSVIFVQANLEMPR